MVPPKLPEPHQRLALNRFPVEGPEILQIKKMDYLKY